MKKLIINTAKAVIETTRESKITVNAGTYTIENEYKKASKLTTGKILLPPSAIIFIEEVAFAEQEKV